MLVLGGARSGKSVTAERLLAGRDRVDYVATGALPGADDPEWAARVRLHQQRRPPHWATLETRDLERVLAARHPPQLATPVLVDCLSTWLAGVMDECGLWSDARGRPGAGRAGGRAAGRVAGHPADVVAVSNEVGSGVVPGTASGVRYRDELGMLNTRVAAECQQVWLCTAGIPRRLR